MTDIIKIENNILADFNNLSIEDITKLIIEIDIKAFYFKGKALQYIKENKRYKELGYKTFEAYVKDVLGFSRKHSYRLLDATKIYDEFCVLQDTFLPTAETQIRPLIELEPEQQIEVWKEVAKNKVPTAKEVQEAVNKKLNKVSGTKKSSTIDTTKYVTIEEHNKALNRIKELEVILVMQSKVIDEYMYKEQAEMTPKTPKTSFLQPRTNIFKATLELCDDGMKKYLTKTNISNQELFRIFSGIRKDYIANNKPFPKDLLLVEGISQ